MPGVRPLLHQQAGQREDALRASIASQLQDGLRWARRVVMDHGWHRRPLIGRPLRWLGRRLPSTGRAGGERGVARGVLPHRHDLAVRDANAGRGRTVGAGLLG